MASSGVIHAINKRNPRNLYQHQNEALTALDKLDTLGSYSTLLVLPTGAGKTYTASTWLLTHALDKGKKILWMAHRHMLLDQAAESFKNFAYLDAIPHKGSFYCRIISGADRHQNSSSISAKDDLLIVSKDSIRSNLERLDNWLEGENEIYLVVDEAHHSTAKTYQRVIGYIKSKVSRLKIIGLTATPTRTFEPEQGLLAKIYTDGVTKNGQIFNNKQKPNVLGMVYRIGLKKLIERRILSDPIFEECKTGKNLGEIIERLGKKVIDKIQAADILPKEIQASMVFDEVRNRIIVNKYKENAARYGKTLVFAVSIEHARILTDCFNKAGIKAAYVVSGTPQAEREKIYDRYRTGDLQVLVNMNILTEGTDLPMTQTVFLTRQTTSTILMTQMIGRALRGEKAGGTAKAYIVSFIDNWNERIMWVVPETVYNAEIDFPDDMEENQTSEASPEAEDEEIIYISREKILEFAKILNEAIDTTELEALPFIERIPLGMYAFEYESKEDGNTEGNDVSYQVMVYNSTKDAYEKFMTALPDLFKELGRFAYDDDSQEYLSPDTLERLLKHCKKNFFSDEMIPPYYEDDIKHILEYYAQKGACPEFYTFAQVDREKLDVAKVAQDIWNEDMGEKAKANYLNDLWENGDKNIWRIFFVDKRYFLRMVEIELTKLAHPELYADYKKKKTIQPADPADFEATELPPSAVNFKTVDDLFDRFVKSTNGQEKLAIKNEILAALSKLKETARQNRDAVAMNQVGIYYRRLHEHDEADRCYSFEKEIRSKTPPPPQITPPAKPNGEPIPGTNLTWRLDDDGTLTISGKGDMGQHIILEKKVTWNELNKLNQQNVTLPWRKTKNLIKKVVIEPGVTSIGNYAFSYCNNLTEVKISDSVTKIAFRAFEFCDSLKEVILPDSVIEVGECAFYYCENLSSVTFSSRLIKIYNSAFRGCYKLSNVNLLDGLKSIDMDAFGRCTSLTEIKIPSSVTNIGEWIFTECKNLQIIRYKRGLNGAEKLREGNNARLIPY